MHSALFSGLRAGEKTRPQCHARKNDPIRPMSCLITKKKLLNSRLGNYLSVTGCTKGLNESEPGLMVENVESAGWASLAGLRQGDLLLKINGKPMSEVNLFEQDMNQWIQQKRKRIIFFVKRGIHTLFLELEPDWDNT